tara:strand:+ start:95 stop:1459 length:1365 start_codon:yes stop_codon:yes gene_type:complete
MARRKNKFGSAILKKFYQNDAGSYFDYLMNNLNDAVDDVTTSNQPEEFDALVVSTEQEKIRRKVKGTDKNYRSYKIRFLDENYGTETSGLPDPFQVSNIEDYTRRLQWHPLAIVMEEGIDDEIKFGSTVTVKKQEGTWVINKYILDTSESYEDFVKRIGEKQMNIINSQFKPASTSYEDYNGPESGLEDQTPVLTAAEAGDIHNNRGLACSSYVAIWVFNQLGMVPKKEKWSDWKAWSILDSELWKRINLSGYGQDFGDTTNIDYIQKKLGGTIQSYSKTETLPIPGSGPQLTVGRWHISQRWCPPGKSGGLPRGHLYLVYWDGGSTVRYLDSSHTRNYRDLTLKKNRWWSGGCSETVLTLPILNEGTNTTSSEQKEASGPVGNNDTSILTKVHPDESWGVNVGSKYGQQYTNLLPDPVNPANYTEKSDFIAAGGTEEAWTDFKTLEFTKRMGF